MAGRRLGPEESALWRKVTASVRPLDGRALSVADLVKTNPFVSSEVETRAPRVSTSLDTNGVGKRGVSATDTLDGGWDRRLRRGVVHPDAVIDLHGHTLATAHGALDMALERAVANEHRVLLVITGKPPRPGGERRGLIRAAIGDWLACSRHAGRIAAVRNAHPRHGGGGALYVVLRRRREAIARNC
jgi:DNA-nicking Smr family endonuclease